MNTTTTTHQISEDGSSEWSDAVLIPENEIELTLIRSFIAGQMPAFITAFGRWVGDQNPDAKTFRAYFSSGAAPDGAGWFPITYGPITLYARAFHAPFANWSKIKVEWELREDFERSGLRALKQGNHAPYSLVVAVVDPCAAEQADSLLAMLHAN